MIKKNTLVITLTCIAIAVLYGFVEVIDTVPQDEIEVLFGILATACILWVVVKKILDEKDKLYTIRVKKNSKRYRAISDLSNRYSFDENLRESYVFEDWVETKSQFDHFDFDKHMCIRIENNRSEYDSFFRRVCKNREDFQQYQREYHALPKGGSKEDIYRSRVPYSVYICKEDELCTQATHNPVVSPYTIYYVYYRSLHGRNEYCDCKYYTFDDLVELCENMDRQIQIKNSAEYQRKIMTDSLRYDVLKRDAFRCVICGRTARDGVKLHVDHIRPVSKGGKTELNNLRTLCDACNMGKRDKYDEYGCN